MPLNKTKTKKKLKPFTQTFMETSLIYKMLIKIKSSSSSYRAGSTDIPDPLSPLLPIVHRPR